MDLRRLCCLLKNMVIAYILLALVASRPQRFAKRLACNQKEVMDKLEEIRTYLQFGLKDMRSAKCILGDAIDSKKGKTVDEKCGHDNSCQLGFDYKNMARLDSISVFRFIIPITQSLKDSLRDAMEYERTVTDRATIPDVMLKKLKAHIKDIIASMNYAKNLIDICEKVTKLPNIAVKSGFIQTFPNIPSQTRTCATEKDEQEFTVLKEIYLVYEMLIWDMERRLYEFKGGSALKDIN